MTLKRDLHVREDGSVCEYDDPGVAYMIGRSGMTLPAELAEAYGVLGDPEYDANAKARPENTKAVSAPPETKAVKAKRQTRS